MRHVLPQSNLVASWQRLGEMIDDPANFRRRAGALSFEEGAVQAHGNERERDVGRDALADASGFPADAFEAIPSFRRVVLALLPFGRRVVEDALSHRAHVRASAYK